MPPPRSIIVVDDETALAEAALARLLEPMTKSEREFSVCLTGGETPKRLYAMMAAPPWHERIPWNRVHWFMGDDRFVPYDDARSNSGIAKRLFLDSCAPADHVHLIPFDAGTPDESAAAYERILRLHQASRGDGLLFDAVLMGVGPDGHTASLFPGSPAAHETARWVVGVPQAPVEPFVPRVSLTLSSLSLTHDMMFLCAGADKKPVLARVFAGENLPAGRALAAAGGDTIWIIDKAAVPANAEGGRKSGGNASTLPVSAIIVMGVSGSGKSTIAAALGERLGFVYEDADAFHPQANIEKLRAGVPLTDEDRWPWLHAIAAEIDAKTASGIRLVIACSALKRIYRKVLVHGRPDIRFVYLKGPHGVIGERLKNREGHFMNPSLLENQFDTLEEPQPDEPAITVDANRPVEMIVEDIVTRLQTAA